MRFLALCVVALFGILCFEGVAAPLSGTWHARLLLILDGPQPKIAQPPFAFDSILQLDLNVSGLQIRSLTALSTVGIEAQVFTLSATLGALTLTDIFLFSRNIVEADQNLQIKLVRPDPGSVVGQYLPIFYKDLVTPYAQLALLLGPTLTESVILRKKIVEAQLVLGGVTVRTVGLVANFGSAGAPQWEVGAVLTLKGQTVSGVAVQSDTYIGARRGLECVGECLPEFQLSQGRVVSGLNFEYERLIVNNIKLAGVTINIDTAINFNDAEGPGGIEYLQITSSFRVEPLALDIGVSITSDLFVCAADAGCFGLDPIYQHDVQLVFKNGPWAADLLIVLLGLVKPLDKIVLTISYTEKGWGWRTGTAIQPSGLKVQEFFVNLSF
jgi:hypothetical protein